MTKDKIKNKNRTMSIFYANLFGMILGIILTFGLNAVWQKYEDKKKTRKMTTLLIKELEVNKKWFQVQEKEFKQHIHAYNMLLAADKQWESIHEDSLQVYLGIINSPVYPFSTSAWQIFQNSDIIQKLSDKDLLIVLTDCYNYININYDMIMKEYWNKKGDELPIEFINDVNALLDELMTKKESFRFLKFVENTGFLFHNISNIETMIDRVISQLDN